MQRIINYPKIYFGSHIKSSQFNYRTLKKLFVSSDENIPIEADGEMWGTLPCEVEIIPSGVNIIMNS